MIGSSATLKADLFPDGFRQGFEYLLVMQQDALNFRELDLIPSLEFRELALNPRCDSEKLGLVVDQ
jgi:hypothetical protein